ncbi:MAG: SdpI family protein [Lachnospirales bacterium]
MVNKRYTFIYLLLAFIPIIYLVIIFKSIPDIVPTSFDGNGIVTEMGSKWTLAILPVTGAFTALIGLFIPFFTKLAKKREDKSLNIIAKFYIAVLVLMDLVSISIIYEAVNYVDGKPSSIGILFCYAFNLFFIIMGFFLPKIPPNAIIGFRIPFTLMDSENWIKTHILAGKLFSLAGIIGLVIAFVTSGNMLVSFIPILTVTFLTIIYSAILFYSKK